MVDRMLKALVSVIVGLIALLYVAHNLANAGAAYEFFVYTTSHADQQAYPVTLLPVPPPFLVVVAMVLVFTLEGAAALLCLYGGWKMFAMRRADAATFESGKTASKIGFGCAILNWWGLFQGIAVAGYQLWQMPLGGGPDHGSWVFGAIAMTSLIYVSQREG